VWHRHGDGVICRLPSVCIRALAPEALTSHFIGRNISSTCNSSGSALWASAKNIKPLIDANCHIEAIELAYHQSPLFSPIYYRNPGSTSRSSSGQTILFGCPLELRTVGGLKKIPLILEYLLDSVQTKSENKNWWHPVGQKHINCTTNSLHCKSDKWWTKMNGIEQAWTGVEATDRAIISNFVQDDVHSLIKVCPP
jgi:hypothetical protein